MIQATGLKTLWYMGSKARIVPEFIDGALQDLLPAGGTLLDICTGTGIVARSVAHRYRILANDVQRFSAAIVRAHLVGDPGWREALDHLEPGDDLDSAFDANLRLLERLAPGALAREGDLLPAVISELSTGAARGTPADDYRRFLEITPDFLTPEPLPPNAGGAGLYDPLLARHEGLLLDRRRDPASAPHALVTLYYSNIYFGLRQAMVIDSLHAAIERIPASKPFAAERKALYLAALLYAASVSTSGTSHFAQPRSVSKNSELLAVARRRAIDIQVEFHRALDAIRREWGERSDSGGHRVYEQEALELLAEDGPLAGEEVGVIYLDPPYTADNYSRFYHVLETLVDYDYPELELRAGRPTKGRYPIMEKRHRSEFCRAETVEAMFRSLAETSARRGSRLLVSYSPDAGLLFKHWRARGETDALTRFHRLFRDYYRRVEVRHRELMHSGQGDSNRRAEELLVLCEE